MNVQPLHNVSQNHILISQSYKKEIKKIDFSKNARVKRLSVSNNEVHAGETSQNFIPAKPFTFVGIEADRD